MRSRPPIRATTRRTEHPGVLIFATGRIAAAAEGDHPSGGLRAWTTLKPDEQKAVLQDCGDTTLNKSHADFCAMAKKMGG
ncbi:hypothetical protein EFV37_35145 (plasmid) [Mesorhizobium loti]|uniref:Uncharacterized protein n=1 Tax=Mesorhizobium jarvisii TaxID=1777867 RepID=A0A6M7TR73_9HYPH|nr:hypothetical protein EB229_35140 [Mesorhizobium jarvisii]QKD13438.1 hypothetical protein EFV37_35145 [Mesorhizobium loti]RJT29547.1 hypothetical protein D3242_28490 [Mesorhizobium jarvisii]